MLVRESERPREPARASPKARHCKRQSALGVRVHREDGLTLFVNIPGGHGYVVLAGRKSWRRDNDLVHAYTANSVSDGHQTDDLYG